MDEATAQGTHANQSGRSGFKVRLELPAAVWENKPTLIPPGGGGSKTGPGRWRKSSLVKSLMGASDVYNPLRSPKTSSDFFPITTFLTKYSLNRKIDFLFQSLLFSCTRYAHRVKAMLPQLI